MRAQQPDLRGWLEEGKRQGATHMLVVLDSFSYEYFPVYVLLGQNVFLVAEEHRTDRTQMRELVEVYSYALPLAPQINEDPAMHYELDASPPTSTVVDLQELSRLAKHAGALERLLALPASFLAHPHWRPAVQSCIDGLKKLLEEALLQEQTKPGP